MWGRRGRETEKGKKEKGRDRTRQRQAEERSHSAPCAAHASNGSRNSSSCSNSRNSGSSTSTRTTPMTQWRSMLVRLEYHQCKDELLAEAENVHATIIRNDVVGWVSLDAIYVDAATLAMTWVASAEILKGGDVGTFVPLRRSIDSLGSGKTAPYTLLCC